MKKEKFEAIKELVNLIDKNIKVEFQDGALECDIEKETVYVGEGLTQEENDLFDAFVKELEPKCKWNGYLMGLLHEVGHILTYDEDLDDDRDMQYGLMRFLFDNGFTDAEQLNKEYFKIPLELNATQWGIDFAMANAELMDKYNKIICY